MISKVFSIISASFSSPYILKHRFSFFIGYFYQFSVVISVNQCLVSKSVDKTLILIRLFQ